MLFGLMTKGNHPPSCDWHCMSVENIKSSSLFSITPVELLCSTNEPKCFGLVDNWTHPHILRGFLGRNHLLSLSSLVRVLTMSGLCQDLSDSISPCGLLCSGKTYTESWLPLLVCGLLPVWVFIEMQCSQVDSEISKSVHRKWNGNTYTMQVYTCFFQGPWFTYLHNMPS